MTQLLFINAAVLDTVAGTITPGMSVLVDGKLIKAMEKGAIDAPGATVIDLEGRTLMPGLIDCHAHLAVGGMATTALKYPSYIIAQASHWLREMINRGFTTVRDAGGADAGLRQAVEEGLFVGPRMFVSGRMISQTGGHADKRWRAAPTTSEPLVWEQERIADGVPECLKAVRDELRRGADQIKIMASGGVASQGDGIAHLQFSPEELTAMVEETARQGTYVFAHVYTDKGIRRAAEAGIRTVEHGNFLGEETARIMAERGTYLVPTLITYRMDGHYGKSVGFSEASLAKNAEVLEMGTRSLEIAAAAGVKIAYGTDLCFSPKKHQPEEFLVRAEVQKPADIIRSATVIGAEVVRMVDKLGVIKPGAFADLLVIDGNPLEDLKLFQNDGQHMAAIIKEGQFIKNTLAH
ncbi:Imidazolonepropionase [Devosia enhydra]|uniref:Imidazolonepropionase n=1 Tax=Devosia enhydra TaxID=665118 RepID=A0A1K2I1L0_9HYPH|nr:amidohydrolase family protein [Devosia enhydra]SFZ85644.1 Imidazolonepropionase [Devosia enhydra]